jgi:hypothetical protein
MDMESVTVQGKKASDHVFTWERIDKCSHKRFGPVIATWMDGLKAALCEDCNLLVWYEGARPELPKHGDRRTKLEKRSKA